MIDNKENHISTSQRSLKIFGYLLIAAYSVFFNYVTQAETANTNTETSLSREQWHDKLGWETSNCPLQSPNESDSGVSIHNFGSNTNIIEIECEHLTYQGTYLFYLRKGGVVTQLNFKQFESPDVGQLESYSSPLVTGLSTVRGAEQSLYVLRKYRGDGDCGQYLHYKVNGNNALLKQLRSHECSESRPTKQIAPNKWSVRKLPK